MKKKKLKILRPLPPPPPPPPPETHPQILPRFSTAVGKKLLHIFCNVALVFQRGVPQSHVEFKSEMLWLCNCCSLRASFRAVLINPQAVSCDRILCIKCVGLSLCVGSSINVGIPSKKKRYYPFFLSLSFFPVRLAPSSPRVNQNKSLDSRPKRSEAGIDAARGSLTNNPREAPKNRRIVSL